MPQKGISNPLATLPEPALELHLHPGSGATPGVCPYKHSSSKAAPYKNQIISVAAKSSGQEISAPIGSDLTVQQVIPALLVGEVP